VVSRAQGRRKFDNQLAGLLTSRRHLDDLSYETGGLPELRGQHHTVPEAETLELVLPWSLLEYFGLRVQSLDECPYAHDVGVVLPAISARWRSSVDQASCCALPRPRFSPRLLNSPGTKPIVHGRTHRVAAPLSPQVIVQGLVEVRQEMLPHLDALRQALARDDVFRGLALRGVLDPQGRYEFELARLDNIEVVSIFARLGDDSSSWDILPHRGHGDLAQRLLIGPHDRRDVRGVPHDGGDKFQGVLVQEVDVPMAT